MSLDLTSGNAKVEYVLYPPLNQHSTRVAPWWTPFFSLSRNRSLAWCKASKALFIPFFSLWTASFQHQIMVQLIQPGNFDLNTNGNLGAIEISTFLSLVLLGVTFSQGYTYFRLYERDRFGLKLLVSVLLLLEVFHSFTASHVIYFETVSRPNRDQANTYQSSANVLCENIITFIVQCFFSHRIYRLSGRLSLTAVCLFCTLLRFAGGIALSVESILDVPRNPNGIFVVQFGWLITAALSVGALADIIIAISMVYYLRKMSSPFNLKTTTAILNRLVRFSLQTGIITSLTSVSVIVCFQAMSNMVWLAVYIILSKLYSISLLVSLNARPGSAEPQVRAQEHASTLQFDTPPPAITVSYHDGNEKVIWSPVWQTKFQEIPV